MDAVSPGSDPKASIDKHQKRLADQRKRRAQDPEKHRLYMRAWRAAHADEYNERTRIYRAAHPEKLRCLNLRKKHGISLEQFNELFLSQGSVCAICRGDKPKGKNWHVDHCHRNGQIRGILCHPCNLMIGQADDNIQTLQAAVRYLGG